MDDDLNSDDYEYEDEAKLVIFPDHYEIALPNIEELPALVSECPHDCVGVHVAVCSVWGWGRVGKASPEEEDKMEQKLGVVAHDCYPSIEDAEAEL